MSREGKSEKKSYQNADCLIRCMNKKDYLFKIIYDMGMYPRFNEENFEFLNVKYKETSINKLHIPMLCFCDIPLKNLTNHNMNYGNYAIALTKSWGEKNKISPIHYLYEDSDVYHQLREVFNLANSEDNEVLFNYLFNRLLFTKTKDGTVIKEEVNKKSGKIEKVPKTILYTDEQEHRYVPNVDAINTDIAQFYINNDLPSYNLSDAIVDQPEYMLTFEVSDIKHIVLNSKDEKTELINNIIESPAIKKQDDKYDLISKLITLQEIKEDF